MNVQTVINPSFVDNRPQVDAFPTTSCATTICRVHNAQHVVERRNTAQLRQQWLCSIIYGHWQTIKTMIVNGSAAKVLNIADRQGRTALMHAVCARRLDIVLALHAMKQLRINASDHEGNTALLLAAYLGDEKLVAALADADPNAPDHQGNTPLIAAVNQGHLPTVVRLQGAALIDINSANSVGLTALHCAALTNHSGIVNALLNSDSINVNAVDENGHSALMLAAGNGHLECAELLRNDPRCNASLRDGDNKTAAILAQEYDAMESSLLPKPTASRGCQPWSRGSVAQWWRVRCCTSGPPSAEGIALVTLHRRASNSP